MMFRTPKLFIILFVLLSMLIAIVFHNWALIKNGQFFSRKNKELSIEVSKIRREIANQKRVEDDEPNSCQCLNDSSNPNLLLIEDKESCKEETLRLQKDFEALPALFKEKRNQSFVDIPRACIVYALKQNKENSCSKKGPICITKEYVNVIYNTFGEVMGCFSIPQKEVFPYFFSYFFSKSQIQINAQSSTGNSNLFKNENLTSLFEVEQKSLENSDNIHCQRVFQQLKKSQFEVSNQCLLTQVQENPLQSFFLFSILFKERYLEISKFISQTEIKEKLVKFGKLDTDHDQLRITLTLGSIHYGREKLIETFQKYLQLGKEGQSFHNFVISVDPSDEFFPTQIAAGLELNRYFKESTCVSDSFLTQ